MNHRFPTSFKRLATPGLALLAAIALLAPCAARATPYVLKLTQQGSKVVASGSGEFDLDGLNYLSVSGFPGSFVDPHQGTVIVTTGGAETLYAYDGYTGGPTNALTGPTSFGSGGQSNYVPETPSFTGLYSPVGISYSSGVDFGEGDVPILFVPYWYYTGAGSFNSSATWDASSFASLGLIPGTYVWTWGTDADQSFTLMVGAITVPEPATLGMFGLGLLLLGGFATLRRREPPQIG